MMDTRKFLVAYGRRRAAGQAEGIAFDMARLVAIRLKEEAVYGVDGVQGTRTLLTEYRVRGPLRSDTASALPAGGGVMEKTPAVEARLSPLTCDSADAAAAGGAAPGAAPMV